MARSGKSSLNAMETVKLDANYGNPFLRALGFDLVVEKLVTYLTFLDMKTLCTASTECLHAVRKTRQFSDQAKFIVSKEVVATGVLKDCKYQWKHLYLDLPVVKDVLSLSSVVLENATSLSLQLPDPFQETDTDLMDFFHKIIKLPRNLQSLRIDPYRKCQNSVKDFPIMIHFPELMVAPLNLKRFEFGKNVPSSGFDSAIDEFIPKIVEATKGTLEALELHRNIWKNEQMEVIRCPNLKSLIVSADGMGKDARNVERFLKNQPPLEELVIEMKEEFPLSIILVLQDMLVNLKKLHMKAKKFSGMTQPLDWKFLKSMTQLTDFHFRKPQSSNWRLEKAFGCAEDILTSLPISCERISLQGFSFFWKNDSEDSGELFGTFPNLKELNLWRSWNAVSNAGLQNIIAKCPKLESLTLTHCYNLTNFGIAGVEKRGSRYGKKFTGLTLANLKGLTSIKIRECPNFSPKDLLKVLRIPYLKYLDYHTSHVVPTSFLFKILRHNPSLEYVSLRFVHIKNDVEYENWLLGIAKRINPGLREIKILGKWQEEDSDSDASSSEDDYEPEPDFYFDEFEY